MRRLLALAVLFAALLAATACNVGPQPLPPGAGAEDTTDPTAVTGGADASAGGSNYADAGFAAPSTDTDGSRGFDQDASDARSDADLDADLDAADGSLDAATVGGDP